MTGTNMKSGNATAGKTAECRPAKEIEPMKAKKKPFRKEGLLHELK